MREIKFRIWNTEEYYYTDPEHLGEYHFGIGKGIDNASEDKIYNTNEWVWQQFTGLKDKNGKEIYEGDILKFDNGLQDVKYYKIWEEKGGLVINQFQDDFKRPKEQINFWSACADKQTQGFIKQLEVIGNIYETQELLS